MQQSTVNLEQILEDRGSQYGDFTTQAEIAVFLKSYVRRQEKFEDMLPHQQEAMDMILHKISRILNGNPRNVDSWADIAGYAQLVADRLQRGGIDKV